MKTARGRGRPAQISRDQIVETALEIGMDRFTMHNVAARLNVTTPALYTHVDSRAELMALVAERLMGGIEDALPDDYDWRAWLLSFAASCRDGLDGSKLTIIAQMNNPTARVKIRVAERGLALLIEAGFEPADAGRALWLVFRTAMTSGTGDLPSIDAQRQMAPELIEPPEDLPSLAAVAAAMDQSGVVDTFDIDIDIVLDGLAQRLARTLLPADVEHADLAQRDKD